MNERIKEEIKGLKLDGISDVKSLKQSCDVVPQKPGVYVVLGNYPTMPEFLEKGTGPAYHYKKNTPPQPMNYPLNKLEESWIDDTCIIYIGKSDDTLRRRISTYIRFGMGNDVAHRGGRAIWQLPDSDNLLIGWKTIEGTPASDVETKWLKEFMKKHNGKLPFANWRK